jgi:dinuclear metal center YbgI/SA1388 family protein
VLLSDVVTALEALYPPRLAEPWDAVGLVCGDPDAQVGRVLFAVDPVAEVVEEAVARGADLLVTHHPLYLRGTSTVAATTPKGRVVHRLVLAGCGLLVAHTNADNARPGVSDALAALFGLQDTVPLAPAGGDGEGTGRVGALPEPLRLSALVERAAAVLPATAWGVRAGGDPDLLVRRLAVSGGAGDGLLAAAAASGAQAFLTSDLRHHPASEAPEGLALLDAAHWATESPWCADAAARLSAATSVQTLVSTHVTDPFGLSSRSPST